MAASNGQFLIQDKLKTPAVHHESFAKLWETKWKKPAEMGLYPFMFGTAKDFEPIVAELIAKDFKEPYNWDEYAKTFFPKAEQLHRIAQEAEQQGHVEKASEYYLRSSAIYRISRFPAPRSPAQHQAWTLGKSACLKGLSLRPWPVVEILIPHTHRLDTEGPHIPVYHLVPSSPHPVPLVIIFTGLDGYRTELSVWMESFRALGVATLVLEIPGTGDCPASPADSTSPDRLYSSLFDWIGTQRHVVDATKVAVWGFSTGAYYAIRVAHTHGDKIAGAVALGGGCHYMFDAAWLSHVNSLEYPFDLADTLAHKWGYGDDVLGFKSEAMAKYSLVLDGTLDRACARLLLVNGVEDEVFPIDDYFVVLGRGAPKEVRFVERRKHMGEPESFGIVLTWLYALFGIEADPAAQLEMLPFKPKY